MAKLKVRKVIVKVFLFFIDSDHLIT